VSLGDKKEYSELTPSPFERLPPDGRQLRHYEGQSSPRLSTSRALGLPFTLLVERSVDRVITNAGA